MKKPLFFLYAVSALIVDFSPVLAGNEEGVREKRVRFSGPSDSDSSADSESSDSSSPLKKQKFTMPYDAHRGASEKMRGKQPMTAADYGVQNLLKAAEQVEKDTMKANLAYLKAVSEGNLDYVAKFLDQKGSDVDAQDEEGISALHVAVLGMNIPIMTLLLDHGADTNITTFDGVSPLHMAARSGEIYIVKLLIDHYADVLAMDDEGRTPADVASFYGHNHLLPFFKETCDSLSEGSDHTDSETSQNVPQGQAVIIPLESEKDSSQLPFHWIEDTDIGDDVFRFSPIHNHNDFCLQVLPDASPYELDQDTRVPTLSANEQALFQAIDGGESFFVAYYLEEGAKIHAVNPMGQTPLHRAVELDNVEICKLLLKQGAKMNMEDKRGLTPLGIALEKGNADLIMLLSESL